MANLLGDGRIAPCIMEGTNAVSFPTGEELQTLVHNLEQSGSRSICELQEDREEAASILLMFRKEIDSSWAALDSAGL